MSRRRRWTIRALFAIGLYLLFAYLLLPALWHHYEHQPNLEDAPKVTVTHSGIPGDPLNVGSSARRTKSSGDARRRLASGRRGHGA